MRFVIAKVKCTRNPVIDILSNIAINVARPMVGDLAYDESYSNTVKPVSNDHIYDKIYYLWFIQ